MAGRRLGACWGHLGLSWGHLGAFWGHLGASRSHLGAILGPSWGHFWAILGHLGAILELAGAILAFPPPRRLALAAGASNSIVLHRILHRTRRFLCGRPPKIIDIANIITLPPDAPDYHPRPLMGTTYYVMQSFRKQDGPAECAKRSAAPLWRRAR